MRAFEMRGGHVEWLHELGIAIGHEVVGEQSEFLYPRGVRVAGLLRSFRCHISSIPSGLLREFIRDCCEVAACQRTQDIILGSACNRSGFLRELAKVPDGRQRFLLRLRKRFGCWHQFISIILRGADFGHTTAVADTSRRRQEYSVV